MLRRNWTRLLVALILTGFPLLVPQLNAAVTMSPTTFTLAPGQSLPLAVAGAGAQGVKWTLTPAMGTLTGSVSSAVYQAPSSVAKAQTVQVNATPVATPSITVKVLITLIPAITLTVSPASADIISNNQQAFAASLVGTPNTAVTWTTSLGSISSTGLYVAPTVALDTAATVTATAQADPTKTATVALRLHPKSGLWFTTQANGLQSLTFNNLNFNYTYGEGLVTSVTTTTANGPVTVVPVCSGSFTSTTVTKHCQTSGADSVDVVVTYSSPAPAAATSTAKGSTVGTIRADIQITNNSSSDTIAQALFSTLGVSMSQYNATASHAMALDSTNPISYANYQTGQWAIWNNAPSPDVSTNMTCGWTFVCKNQPIIKAIAPGQTKMASFTLRFTDDVTATTLGLAPEAFSAFRAAYPSVVNWPDRRPIMSWFVADYNHQSATNPRGYLFDPTLDVSNVANFTSKIMAQAQTVLTQIQSRPVQPQGIIIWDLEGEEFVQSTTYVGDPRVLSEGYAPEMNATADQLFALFRNAGLKVGITLRPQQLQWGTVMPTSCNYSTDFNYKDYFIKVNSPLGQKFYACNDPAGVNWTLIPHGNGGQTFYTPAQVAQVTALMMSKVQYAYNRWHTQLYYVDTSVWVGGAPLPQDVFRALELAYPDCIFIPEENYAATMGVAMPFSDPKNTNAPKFSPLSWRYIYPTGALGIYLSNCVGTCWTNNAASFDIGQKVGDIPMYTVPLTVNAQLLTTEALILQARSEAGHITVTDSTSGAQFSYTGSPSTVYQYPVKMRVYFAATAAGLPASTTFCESGGWAGENTCTLNLAGLITAQIRYYDFTDQLVITGSAQPR